MDWSPISGKQALVLEAPFNSLVEKLNFKSRWFYNWIFRTYWKVIKSDIVAMFLDFYNSSVINVSHNPTYLFNPKEVRCACL